MASYNIEPRDHMNEVDLILSEEEGAIEALTYLLKENIVAASTCRTDGAFVMAFSLKFQRCAGPTMVKAKVSYSKKMGEELDVMCRDAEQGELFGEEAD